MSATSNIKRETQGFQQTDTARLVMELASRNGLERRRARAALVALGDPAVGPLIAALSSDRSVTRWEAAKAFTELHTPAAAQALVQSLSDEDGDVRWLAAEALVGLGESALVPLFESLMARADSIELREGAHHVLRALNSDGLAEIVGPVLTTLEHYEPELAVPFSAEEALVKLKERQQ